MPGFSFGRKAFATQPPRVETTRPKVSFADVGGCDDAKKQITEIVQNRLNQGKLKQYGVVRNGILLHGPRGSGKTFLAEATAGEFGLNYFYVSPSQLTSMWVGGTENNLRGVFSQALANKPVLVLIDEIDTLGAARVNIREAGDLGGSNRGYNDAVVQLMQSIDQRRDVSGFVLMGATNLVDGLDPALVREGRFDVHIRVDMPDEGSRARIFEAQLSKRPWRRCNLNEFAQRTPGASAAKIKSLVDRASAIAAAENRQIEERDLRCALDDTGGRDRPLLQPVEWHDLIVEEEVERDLRTLVKQLNAGWSRVKGITVPTGVVLSGQPGTGKTMIGRLIATQTRRSFYPLSAADILGGQVGGSVKKLSEVFARARENSPSIIFFDEIDGLMPRNNGMQSTHDTQLVEQCRTEISQVAAKISGRHPVRNGHQSTRGAPRRPLTRGY